MAILNTTFIGGGGLKEGDTFFFDYTYTITTGGTYGITGYDYINSTATLIEKPICLVNRMPVEYEGTVYRATTSSGDFESIGSISGNRITLTFYVASSFDESTGYKQKSQCSFFGKVGDEYYPLLVSGTFGVAIKSSWQTTGTLMNAYISGITTTKDTEYTIPKGGQGNVVNINSVTFYPLSANVNDDGVVLGCQTYLGTSAALSGKKATVTKDASVKGIKITGVS